METELLRSTVVRPLKLAVVSTLLICAGGAVMAAAPTDMSVPMFASSPGDPYNFAVAPAQTGPSGTIEVTKTAPQPAYSFEDFKQNIHGYVETGVSSRGGYGVDGGVLLPLVPGRAELEVGVGTGQTGSLFPKVPALKHESAAITDYHATLHVHPADDLDIAITYAGQNLKLNR
jgi:hypothetical protein